MIREGARHGGDRTLPVFLVQESPEGSRVGGTQLVGSAPPPLPLPERTGADTRAERGRRATAVGPLRVPRVHRCTDAGQTPPGSATLSHVSAPPARAPGGAVGSANTGRITGSG